MREDGVVGQRHFGFVNDKVSVLVAYRFFHGPVAKERECAPTLGVDHISTTVGVVDVVAHLKGAASVCNVLPRPINVTLIKDVIGVGHSKVTSMPKRVAMVSAELATAVFKGLG